MANIAFIGLGNMGGPMAANLVKAGHKVQGFDLVQASRDAAKADGVGIAATALDAVKGAEIVVTMLPAGKHVLGVWKEIIPAVGKNTLMIDCSTIDVESARLAHAHATERNLPSIDAPVSGGTGGAKGATLTFMCGGTDASFAAAKPVLENMGKKVVHCGEAGAGQAAKICNNMILGISMIGVSEAFALGEKLGLSHQALFDVASTSSGQCWSLTSYCPVPGPVPASPANNDYKPGFAAALMLKDLRLSQEAAKAAGAATPLGAHAESIYDAFEKAGHGGVDFSGIIKHLRGLAKQDLLMTTFRDARAFLLKHRTDYDKAIADFRWPDEKQFNWALDWFDAGLARDPESRDRTALWIVDAASNSETKLSFAELSRRSNQTANFLRDLGLKRGDHLLMLLGNVVPLWETMLAAMKLGVIVIPATTLLTADELRDRLNRGKAKVVVATQDQVAKFEGLGEDDFTRIVVAATSEHKGWRKFEDAANYSEKFAPDGVTNASDPMLLYFTSGTTAKPKLVLHSHRSYPVGSLSTMYWLGLQPGDVHLNISSPGWAKHAWSCFFSPWNAGATIFIVNQPRFDAKGLLATVARCGVTTLCAPPTVWRLFIQERLADYKVSVREVCGAGEPLNPEVIDQVKAAWGLTIRDGYGQTETTALAGNSPGQPVKIGSMGRPMPGYTVRVADADGNPAKEGEVRLVLGADRPAGLMLGYQGDDGKPKGADGDVYQTGDVVFLDDDGYLTFVGRSDDVFKSSDYRISPFELESVLLEHELVAEAAVVPTPDPIRLALPKAYVSVVPGTAMSRDTALSIFQYVHSRLAPFKRIRRIELVTELPKTISGKIRRVQLRRLEHENDRRDPLRGQEFREEDFPELQSSQGAAR